MINIHRVIRYVTNRSTTITNTTILELAGGTDKEWRPKVAGAKVSCVVQMMNPILKEEGWMLSSEGVGSEQWQLVTVAEGNRRAAEFNFKRADKHFRDALDSVQAIIDDERAPDRIRDEAQAWMELAKEPRQEKSLAIMTEFALELATTMHKHARVLKLVEIK